MASDESFAQLAVDHMAGAGQVTFRKMFGEYGIYCEGVLVALVCDNQLFVKPTMAGRRYLVGVTEASPYPGAKPAFLVEDGLDDRAWLSGLIGVTYTELAAAPPKPKPKPRAKPKPKPKR